MPIQIKHEGGWSKVVVACRVCGSEIEDARDGNYYFPVREGMEMSDVYFTHSRCSKQFEEEYDLVEDTYLEAQGLDVFPVYFFRNLGLDEEETRKRVYLFGTF